MVGNASGIDLNNAELYDLGRIGGLGRARALRIIQNRPIRKWQDLEKIEGFDHELVNDLRGSGAKLGRMKKSSVKKPNVWVSQRQRTPSSGAKAKPGRGKPARNIFSGRGMLPD